MTLARHEQVSRQLIALLAAVLIWLPAAASAEVLLFVQGYLSDDDSWRSSGVAGALRQAGWNDGGHLRLDRGGVWLRAGRATRQGHQRFFTLALPTQAPLQVQAGYLEQYVDFLRTRFPNDSLILVGHSAGGVVARLYMVQHPKVGVDMLVTIASPHLGTEVAELGAQAGRTPLSWIAPLLGAEAFNWSQGLYHDLMRERPQTLLFWLNRQPHPPAHYVGVVRTKDGLFDLGDLVVPVWSQDLNNVYALRDRAKRVDMGNDHGLSEKDGKLIARLLKNWQRL